MDADDDRAGEGRDDAASPGKRPVRRALRDALASPQFAASPQLAKFLTFIVETTLDGREADIKAYTIAVDALDKPESFDPQTNAAVRVAAGRLRRALDLHNSQDGEALAARADDAPSVEISLEAGSYVPSFRIRERAVAPVTTSDADGAIPDPAEHPGNEPGETSDVGNDGLTTGALLDGANSARRSASTAPLSPSQGAAFASAAKPGPVVIQPPAETVTSPSRRFGNGWSHRDGATSAHTSGQNGWRTVAIALMAFLLGVGAVSLGAYFGLAERLNASFGGTAPLAGDTIGEPPTGAVPASLEAPRGTGRILSRADDGLRPRIGLTVLYPDEYPDWFSTGEVTDAITLAMTRFDDYQFTGVKALASPPLDGSRAMDYHLLVTAYRRGEAVRIFGRLIRQVDGTVLWSTQQRFDPPEDVSARDVVEIAGRTFAPVGSPYGVIHADLRKTLDPRRRLNCVLATYRYFSDKSDARHTVARDCAERLRDSGTRLPAVFAALTFLSLDEYREGRNIRQGDPLRAAESMAVKAVEFGPQSARAHQALFAVYKVARQYDRARAAANRAVALNPYDTDILGDYGAWLVSIGDYAEGRAYLSRAQEMLDSHPAWVDVYRYLSFELANYPTRADAIGALMDAGRSPLTALCVAITAARQSKPVRLRMALDSLRKSDSTLYRETALSLKRRGFAPGVAEALAERFRAAVEKAG